MTTIIGVDPSLTATGLVRWRDGRITNTTVRTPAGMPTVERHHTIVMRLLAMRDVDAPNWVVIEAPIHPSGDNVKNRTVPLDLFALRAVIYHGLYMTGIQWVEVHLATLKLYATGNGRASKPDMLVASHGRLGRHFYAEDADQADAGWLMAMGVAASGHAPLCPLPRRNLVALARPKWPRAFQMAGTRYAVRTPEQEGQQ